MSKTYEITVKTGTVKYAGTDSDIHIKLYDKNGNRSAFHEIDDRRDNFEKGKTEVFTISESQNLSDIEKIRIIKNSAGSGEGWFVKSVSVKDTKTKKVLLFRLIHGFQNLRGLINLFIKIHRLLSIPFQSKQGLKARVEQMPELI